MGSSISTEHFRTGLRAMLTETFERSGGGVYLDENTAYHLGEIRQALCTIKVP